MRFLLYGSLFLILAFGCKTTQSSSSRVKAIQYTPDSGVPGILDNVPLLIESGKPSVVSINKLAGAPDANSQLRLDSLELSIKSADSYATCNPVLKKVYFSEQVERDVKEVKEMQSRATYRMQELSMTIEGDAEKGWTLYADGGHDVGDLYLQFESQGSMTCRVSAVGWGYYVRNSTAGWGEGSGDPERDRLIRAWGSDRGHRLWHFLWHGMRGAGADMEQPDRAELVKSFGPSVLPPVRNGARSPDGEDFLFMHHNMLKSVRAFLESKGKSMVPAWKVLPRMDDKVHPSVEWESQEQFDTWEKDLQDIERIKTMTLGEYGEEIERTIHNAMHMRFRNPDTMETPMDPLRKDWEQVFSKVFDDPANDYLGGTYSSHVNPVFFMIHGWVDDRIQTWLEAHGKKTIGTEAECKGEESCYVWLSDERYGGNFKGTEWEGIAPGPERNGAGLHNHSMKLGNMPELSAHARALLYKTRRMGGF